MLEGPRRGKLHGCGVIVESPEGRLDELQHLSVVEASRRRDDNVRRLVGALEEDAEVLAAERFDRFAGTENRYAEWVIEPEGGAEFLPEKLLGSILDGAQLLEDHGPLALNLLLLEQRIQNDVRDQLEGILEVNVEHVGVVTSVLFGGESVELTTHGIDLEGDLLGRAIGGPLEQHVLDEVGDTRLFGRFEARTHLHPHTEAGGAYRRHTFGDDDEVIFQLGPLDTAIGGHAEG